MATTQKKPPPSVAVVGGGWYGCHIAHELKSKGFKVVLLEKSDSLFGGASGKNQFRLHAGFHYPRSSITRKQITSGLREFKEKLPHLVHPLDLCIYAISSNASLVDFGTFKQVFEATGVEFTEIYAQNHGLTNVEGCINTSEEMFFFVDAPKSYYEVMSLLPRAATTFSELFSLPSANHRRLAANEYRCLRSQNYC